MFKLYKRFRPIDWVLTFFIMGFTILQVYCTITMTDYVSKIISSITMLDYHNNPANMPKEIYDLISMLPGVNQNGSISWEVVNNLINQGVIPESIAASLSSIANASSLDIWFNGGMIVLVAFSGSIAQGLIAIMAAYISSNFATTIRSELNEKISNFSLAEINKFSIASLVTRTTNDVQQCQMANLLMMRMIFAAPVTFIWALCKIQVASWELSVATAVAIVVMVLGIATLIMLVVPKFGVIQKKIDRLNGVTEESLLGIRVVRAFNGENYQFEKSENLNSNLTELQLFAGRTMAFMTPIMTIVMNGISLAIYYLGAKLINQGTISYSTVTSFIMLVTQIIMSFLMLVMMFVLWPRAEISAKRINEVFDIELSIKDPATEKEFTKQGCVEFKDVCFRYPEASEDVIEHVSFKADKGQTVAFIGSTGSGKSSLVNLVSRLYDVTSGEVLVDGVNVKDVKQSNLRKKIGFVPQKGLLFTGTIKDNIAFGNPNISEEEIVKAANISCASEFIEAKDEKYDSLISQGGTNVSGGQRQRLCIARAIAINPEILVFDDSFSALDYKTDLKVRDNLKKELKDVTKLIVAARIGTIMDADQILVLDKGKVVGQGTHQELLKNCQVYKEIALSQLSKEELGL